MIDRLNLKYYAEYFHEMDLNISCISAQTTKNNFLYGPKRLKAPSHDWGKYQVERQPLEVLQNYDWEKALGIGLILGYNNIVAIDIDGCTDEQIVTYILSYLQLPKDYSWVVKSGSQAGYHIFLKTQLPPPDLLRSGHHVESYHKVDYKFGHGDTNAYYPKTKSNYDKLNKPSIDSNSFCKIEFCWKRHVVLPPSIHASGRTYKFLYDLPQKSPIEVNFDLLSSLQFDISGNAAVSSTSDGLSASNNESLSPNDNNILIIDTETNGLPLNNTLDFSHTDNWPRVLQLTWLVCKKLNTDYQAGIDPFARQELFLLKRDTRNITPNNFILDKKSILIHGLTEDFLKETGEDLKIVLNDFLDIVAKCDTIIGHNIEFDLNVIKCEMIRCGIFDTSILDNKSYCTMKNTTNLCRIGDFPYKYPSLRESYRYLVNKEVGIEHNSLYDAYLTMKCYNKILFNDWLEY